MMMKLPYLFGTLDPNRRRGHRHVLLRWFGLIAYTRPRRRFLGMTCCCFGFDGDAGGGRKLFFFFFGRPEMARLSPVAEILYMDL
jgi:hypothetical protein